MVCRIRSHRRQRLPTAGSARWVRLSLSHGITAGFSFGYFPPPAALTWLLTSCVNQTRLYPCSRLTGIREERNSPPVIISLPYQYGALQEFYLDRALHTCGKPSDGLPSSVPKLSKAWERRVASVSDSIVLGDS